MHSTFAEFITDKFHCSNCWKMFDNAIFICDNVMFSANVEELTLICNENKTQCECNMLSVENYL